MLEYRCRRYTPALIHPAASGPLGVTRLSTAKVSLRSDAPPTRIERKELTRQRLIDAALSLVGQGSSFSSLSLREVTRTAGVVPAAFYRHFRDLDELGFALVDIAGVTLRRVLREARRNDTPLRAIMPSSVRIYMRYVHAHGQVFRFIAGERGGGSPAMRQAIRNEERHFASEMAHDLRALGMLPAMTSSSLHMVCEVVVATMFNAASDILDVPKDQPTAERELIENFVRQLRLILLGAAAWRERPAKAPAA